MILRTRRPRRRLRCLMRNGKVEEVLCRWTVSALPDAAIVSPSGRLGNAKPMLSPKIRRHNNNIGLSNPLVAERNQLVTTAVQRRLSVSRATCRSRKFPFRKRTV